jgi:hypothetical protein
VTAWEHTAVGDHHLQVDSHQLASNRTGWEGGGNGCRSAVGVSGLNKSVNRVSEF